MNTLDALATAQRLEELGLVIRSAELQEEAKQLVAFRGRGGNRAMRRAAARAARKRARR